jgi:hypothetical protein
VKHPDSEADIWWDPVNIPITTLPSRSTASAPTTSNHPQPYTAHETKGGEIRKAGLSGEVHFSGYHSMTVRPSTRWKWASRVASGISHWSATASIQISFSGMAWPLTSSSTAAVA